MLMRGHPAHHSPFHLTPKKLNPQIRTQFNVTPKQAARSAGPLLHKPDLCLHEPPDDMPLLIKFPGLYE